MERASPNTGEATNSPTSAELRPFLFVFTLKKARLKCMNASRKPDYYKNILSLPNIYLQTKQKTQSSVQTTADIVPSFVTMA